MDTAKRTLVKGLTWQALGVITMTVLTYPHTESLLNALAIAGTSSASGFVFFMIHERIWNSIGWGRKS